MPYILHKPDVRMVIGYFLFIMGLINFMLFKVGNNYNAFFEENGILENSEVVLLCLAALNFLYGFVAARWRSITFFSFIVCLAFILRELDVEKFNLNSIILFLGSGVGRVILLTSLFIIGFYLLYKEITFSIVKRLMNSMFFYCLIFSSIFLVLSWVFDKKIFDIPYLVLLEELSELNAYFIIFLASIVYSFEFKK